MSTPFAPILGPRAPSSSADFVGVYQQQPAALIAAIRDGDDRLMYDSDIEILESLYESVLWGRFTSGSKVPLIVVSGECNV